MPLRYDTHSETREVTVLRSFVLIGWIASAQAEVYPGAEPISGALHVDITESGFDALGGAVPLLAPGSLPVDGVSDSGGWWCANYAYDVSGLTVEIDFDDVRITPNAGYLDVDLVINVAVNTEGSPFSLYTELACIPSDCDGWVDPFEVDAHTTIALDVIEGDDGGPALDVVIGDFEVAYELTSDLTHLEGCPLGTTVDVLDWFGLDVVGLIIDSLSDTLNNTIADLAPELESAMEDAFSAAVIEQELELQDKTLSIGIQPGEITVRPDGLRLSMDAYTGVAESDACIAEYDDGTYSAVESEPPRIGTAPDGIAPSYAAAVLLSDNFGNQLLYSAWKSGLLCYTVDEELGFPIDTSILGLLAGEAFNDLFPDAKPMVIETRPVRAPTLSATGDNDLNVAVDALGLDFMAELDHRTARVLGMDLNVDAGIDLDFDGGSGALAVNIDLGEDAIAATVGSNDFVPDASETIEASFGNVFNGLVGGLLGDALGDINVALPGFSGIGLTELTIAPAGTDSDWVGGYASLGEVSYASAGCSDDGGGGCADDAGGGCGELEGEGCSGGGCASAPRNQRRWFWLTFPVALIALRRRP